MFANYPFIDSGVIDDLFKYQLYRLSDPAESYPVDKKFKYNIHDAIEFEKRLEKKDNTVRFDAKNYNSDLFLWAKEVLWFGRRVGKYKNSAEIIYQ